MVNSVVAVPKTASVRRDRYNSSYSEAKAQTSNNSFAKVLEEAKKEENNIPMSCHTVSYGRDSRIQSFDYQTREYRF